MRPDILNPLFAEVRAMKGVGPGLAKPLEKLGLVRIKDVLYHFPASWTYRKAVQRLDVADVGSNIIVHLVSDGPSQQRQRAGTFADLCRGCGGQLYHVDFLRP